MQAICDDLLQKQSASGRQIISIPLKQPKQRHNNPDNPVGADKALMTKPELFDVIELLVDLPEDELRAGTRGAIVECYDHNNYEIEFTNQEGETLALYTLSSEQFIVSGNLKLKVGYQYLKKLLLGLAICLRNVS